MTTLLGLVLMAGGITVLAMVRPWRREPDDEPEPGGGPAGVPPADEAATAVLPRVMRRSPSPRRPRPGPGPSPGPSPGSGPGPGPGPKRRQPHEVAQLGRRVPAEPGRPEIPLPDWLGPGSAGSR